MYSQTLLVAPTLRVSSPLSPLSVPSICISPAADATMHPDTPALEPSSPEAQSPRSVHLLPPPILSPLRRSLAPSGKVMDKKGLDQSTFEDLLIANRERAAKRSVSAADRLRREVVVKAHHSKQIERRALFLSKIAAPPSPTSAETAVTPPESPAVFHFTLPSPGLASPLELFETVKSRDSWVEHVDYNNNCTKRMPSRLPSLDQITARLRPTVIVESPVPILAVDRQDEVKPRASRLPDSIRASTRARSTSPPTVVVTPSAPAPVSVPAPVAVTSTPPAPISPPKPKSVKSVLVPQSIPALRINHAPSATTAITAVGPELAPVPVMSWRDRAAPTPRKEREEPRLWRDRQGQITSWREREREREIPVRKDPVRHVGVAPISPRTTLPLLPIGSWRVEREVKLTESERRAVQGRNMLDKLRRRISAPAEMQGSMKRGVPVGGF
ncbi:hypothetical protein FS749_002039 [Ceratobasidium sp. UAMH 11750]|nr:hypothetical protein FS749_002039 [Ceratobasidium sp. UAMH 11750]